MPIENITDRRIPAILEDVNIHDYERGAKCPFCGNYDVERNLFGADEEFWPDIRVPVECETCGKKWAEVYGLKELWVLAD